MAVPSAACLPRPAAPRPPPSQSASPPIEGLCPEHLLLLPSGCFGPAFWTRPPWHPSSGSQGQTFPRAPPPTSASPRQASNPGWPHQGLFPQEQPRAEWTPLGGSSHGGLLGAVPRGRNGRVANRTREWLSAAAPWGRPPSPLSLPHRSLSSAGPAPTPPLPSSGTGFGVGGTHAQTRLHTHAHIRTPHTFTRTPRRLQTHTTHSHVPILTHVHTQLQADLFLLPDA